MSPEIISPALSPDLEPPVSETFSLNRAKTYTIKSSELEISLQRIQADRSHTVVKLRIGAKAKVSIAAENILKKTNWSQYKRQVEDPEEFKFLSLTLNQTSNRFLFIDGNKLILVMPGQDDPKFRFASAVPFEIEVVDDPINKLK